MRAVNLLALCSLTVAAGVGCNPRGAAPGGETEPLVALRAIPAVKAPPSPRLRRIETGFVGLGTHVLPATARGALRLGTGDAWIEVRPRDGADVPGEIVDGTLVFRKVAPATDLVFVDEAARVEEWRLLRDASAPTTTRYVVRVGPGVAALRTRVGRIEVVDHSGRVAFGTEDLRAFDAAGTARALSVELGRDGDGWTFSLTLDPTGLVFPVAVDPAWTPAPLMLNGRGHHAAVALPDGRVLVMGGYGGGGALQTNTTEIYDPVTNTFTASGAYGQGEGQAVAINSSGIVFRGGGTTKLGPVATAALFTTSTSSWAYTPTDPPYRFYDSAAVAYDATHFLMCGGSNASGATGNDCVVYNTAAAVWTIVKKMNVVRNGHTLTLLADGTVLATGGDAGGTAERFNIGTNTWTNVPAMKVARDHHSATRLASGRVLVVGNSTGTQLFDPATNTWSDGGPLAASRSSHTATLLPDGRVLVAGGGPTSAELYDPATNTFSTAGPMGVARSLFASAILPDGRVLATGDFSSATTSTEVWGQLVGAACTANYECANNHCVDNVCCGSASCPAGAKCNLAGKVGTCSKPLGATCSAGTECVSGQCADGYCCNSACTGQCSACNVVGKLGTCTPVTGAPVGTRAACTGTGLGSTCGPRCDGYDGAKCNYPPTSTACGSDSCSAGVESHVGTCNGAGTCLSTSKSCGTYKCGATACLTTCTSNADCVGGYRCKDGACAPTGDLGSPCTSSGDCSSKTCADGFCCEVASCGVDGSCGLPGHEGSCRTKQGKACAKDTECGTDHCVDGVCCDGGCDGQCEACDVEGKVGLCAPVTGGPHGARPKCDDGGGDVCKARTCKGASSRTTCEGWVNGPTVTCAAAKCDGASYTEASKCDGAGNCASPGASSCVPYRCGDKGCLKTCTKNDECATGYACLGNRCEPTTATCSDDGLSSIGRDGTKADCVPYRCVDSGDCGKTCDTSSECAPGFACDSATHTCLPPAPVADEGGCATSPTGRRGGGALGLFVGIGALVALRRRAGIAGLLGAVGAAAAGGCSPKDAPSPSPTVVSTDPLVAPRRVAPFAARLAAAVTPISEGGGFTAGARLVAHLPARADGVVRLARVDGAPLVEVSVLDVAPTVGVLHGGALVYEDASLDADVVQLVDGAGVEELRTLRSAKASPVLRWQVRPATGHSVRVREGRIEVVDAMGRVEVGTAPLFAVDAHGVRRDLTVTLDGEVVTARLDPSGLSHPIVVDPAWSLVASMSKARMLPASVVLADGRFLVVGGEGGANDAEIYDPVANTWSGAGTMGHSYGVYPGGEPAAVTLPSGKVLVRLLYADRFDPAAGTWSAAGAPTKERVGVVALATGKVLAVCTSSGSTADAVAELYDETTNAWTTTGSLGTARGSCTAVRLADGRVLVAGGQNGTGTLSTAEIYNPATGTWTATGSMVTAAPRRAAILHSNGKVVVTGPGTSAEVFDPTLGKWSALPAMAGVHERAAMTELKSGRVLVAGGVAVGGGGNFTSSSTAELYDFATNSWSTGGTMGNPRAYAPGVRLPSNRVLVVGGATKAMGIYGVFVESSAELYGGVLGTTCTDGWECASGNCVDGVCCGSSACPFAAVCNTKEKPGTCAKVNGLACGASTECASSQCVDGYCCDTACKGQCEACDLPSKFGVCSPVLGPPRGARSACSSTGGDPLCGNRCDGSDRTSCHTPGAAAACGVNACVGGVETHASTCDTSGKCGDTPKSCGAYACDVSACKTKCDTKADCAPGYQCKSGACFPTDGLGTPCKASSECATGFCTDGVCCGEALCAVGSSCAADATKPGRCAKLPGTSCAVDAECGSGFCVDGVCCGTRCGGQCEACDVPGSLGKCTPVAGQPHGLRPACADGGTETCKARACDGVKDATKCVAFTHGAEKSCKAPSCTGTDYVAEGVCDGAGGCTTPSTQACAPYRCDDAGCRTTCAKKEHCADGATCVKGTCQPIVATCSSDRLSSTDKAGVTVACNPYRCGPTGQCGTQCASSADCSPDAVCDVATKICAPLDTGASQGGCAFGAAPLSAGWGLLVAAALLRRRRCASR